MDQWDDKLFLKKFSWSQSQALIKELFKFDAVSNESAKHVGENIVLSNGNGQVCFIILNNVCYLYDCLFHGLQPE